MSASPFKVKKNLTKPLLKFVEGAPVYVKIEGAMFVGKEMKGKNAGTEPKKKEPATLCDVTDLTTGEACQIILHAVVKSVLTDEYPNDSYVGKGFQITKMGKAPGKDYNRFDVQEIELPEAEVVSSKKK
jgi:hypothetical protein